MPELCVKCKGTKLLCGRPKCPLLERARLLQDVNVNKRVDGASPPSVFVGRFGYPKVYVGPMVASDTGDVSLFDLPEKWARLSLDEIAAMRARLIRTKELVDVHSARDPPRDLHEMQLATMSKASVGMDVEFKKAPRTEVSWNDITAPHGLSGDLERFVVEDNPKIPRRVDDVVNDEIKASDALYDLYSHGIPVSKLYNLLSIGVLGVDKRLVPTRWSITATDDTLGKRLIDRIKEYTELNEYLLFEGYNHGNRYEVLLIQGEWEFDMVEIYDPGCIWVTGGENPVVISDYEPYDGRTSYADNITGAYYAARLAVLEYLARLKRQAKALVVREITPEYWMPVGVWQIRENVRQTMSSRPIRYDSLRQALDEIDLRLNVKRVWRNHSEMLARIRSREALMKWIPNSATDLNEGTQK